jgi:regulator of nucleoside diphosphate kinase
MNTAINLHLSPDILVGRDEHRQLLLLAMAGTGHSAEDADWLLYELERAMVVPDHSVPNNVVRMGSTVRYRTTGGLERTVQIVFPKEADIAKNRISILTPVGSALIGLRRGQSISYRARDGRTQSLTVLEVVRSPDGEDPGPMAA